MGFDKYSGNFVLSSCGVWCCECVFTSRSHIRLSNERHSIIWDLLERYSACVVCFPLAFLFCVFFLISAPNLRFIFVHSVNYGLDGNEGDINFRARVAIIIIACTVRFIIIVCITE